MRSIHLALGIIVALSAAGCYPSNVLDATQRKVSTGEPSDYASREWSPVEIERFPGAYASELIEGEAAASMIEVRYIFHVGGTYSGAALVSGDENLEYQTLRGAWALQGDELSLDGVVLVADASGDLLRLESAGGRVLLRRIELN